MLHWLVGGDFNDILFANEKQGGILREEVRMEAFRQNLESCQLMDIGYLGPWFTWERGRLLDNNIRERIDRGVANDALIQLFPSFSLRHLPHSFFDHCPLLIETEVRGRESRIDCFCFEAWWALEDS
ncbi:hypothetical protein PVK06_034300 [Gossypium arboreum]|uniref:Reverse transcriptase n=1 Tax=Gossypium arboreum TaxID=29729 RepID=A0ABR0NDT7_GOSAR|nr:hypothetical protein PVK06_034300 [Gossypium arboreum]